MATEENKFNGPEFAITDIKVNSIDDGGGITIRIQDVKGGTYDEEHFIGPDTLLFECGFF